MDVYDLIRQRIEESNDSLEVMCLELAIAAQPGADTATREKGVLDWIFELSDLRDDEPIWGDIARALENACSETQT